MTMEMHSVKSSNISAIAHDPDKNVLRVRFNSGDVWDYEDVPSEKHFAMKGAPSIGSYFHQHIRTKHVGRKVNG
jgi:hypothetical protein